MSGRRIIGAALLAAAYIPSISAEILIADRYRNSVGLYSSADGALIELDYIIGAGPGVDLDSPIEALVVGSEIWLSDQNLDGIFRYDLQGQYLGVFVGPASGLDNIRGFHVADNVLWVTNFGDQNGAGGPGFRKFDATTGANLGTVEPPGTRSPWDVMSLGGAVLGSDDLAISTNPLLDTGAVFNLSTTPPGIFASGSAGTNGLSLPKQMIELASGNLLIANNGTPRALLEYNASGVRVATYPTGSLRANGLFELENGLILIAGEDTGVVGTNGHYTLDRTSGALTPLRLGSNTPGGLLPASINAIELAPPVCPGDLNCDGVVDFADIDLFVEALGHAGGAGWPHPDCPWISGDANGDDDVTFDDIDAFVALIGSTCP